jgi:outer membrane protein TolC
MELGLVTKGELLQLELAMLNAEMSISYNRLTLENRLFALFSYLHISDYKNIELVAPTTLPEISISSDDVISRAYSNSTHSITQQLSLLSAEQNLAYTKANNGLQVSLQAQIGLTQSADGLHSAYRNLKDNEVIGITISLPIYDWGMGRGKTRMAKAQLELARTQVAQNNLDFEQEIRTTVMYFNNQAEQCKISRRALEIAEETYLMAYKRYENGAMTVTDFNVANNELESAQAQYLSQLNTFWSYYYTIQRLTLYDYIRNEKLDCDFDKLVK